MKTIRNIAPALLIVAVLVALALGIGLMSRDGRRQPDTTPADDTPNAGLSNSELVNKAVTNMRSLSSYHMEFNGPAPLSQGGSAQMKLLADVQSPGRTPRRFQEAGTSSAGVSTRLIDWTYRLWTLS